MFNGYAEKIVILHANDTHSLIEPDNNGKGGVLQRKAIVDSVKNAEKNVLLVHAGDLVQGTLYFKFFRGDVEYPLADMMGYDIQILGNHEFDNGLEELAAHYSGLKADRLSANYDFSETPLAGMFMPWSIKEIAGKKIGFIGLNVDPESLISRQNYAGMKFKDIVDSANGIAGRLRREEGCDLIVAVTHIGAVKENEKITDYELAAASKDIDIIIGGHSHSMIMPGVKFTDREGVRPGEDNFYPSIVRNADGRNILVAQTGKYGRMLGYIALDSEDLNERNAEEYDYRLIPVTDRFPESMLDKDMMEFIRPFKQKVDSVNSRIIARAYYSLNGDDRVGGYPNFAGDFAKWYGDLKSDSIRISNPDFPKVDIGLMNVGGIRQSMPAGDVTEGEILATFPFANHLLLTRLKGRDFMEAMKMAASKGGEGVSDEVRVLTDGLGAVRKVLVNGEEIDPDRDYVVCTINYVAEGNDDFVTFRNGDVIWEDDVEVVAPLLRYIENTASKGLYIAPDPTPRFLEYQGV